LGKKRGNFILFYFEKTRHKKETNKKRKKKKKLAQNVETQRECRQIER
jgi:hypothetical protein